MVNTKCLPPGYTESDKRLVKTIFSFFFFNYTHVGFKPILKKKTSFVWLACPSLKQEQDNFFLE